MKVNNVSISQVTPPFIIAEMSGNHNQSLDNALKIVEKAALAGVQAIKLQTYTADTMTINCSSQDFLIKDENSLWNGENLYDLYNKAHTPWEWHKQIFDKASALGLVCFSSPFDESAVDFLEELNNPLYKIASFEFTDIPLIKKVISTKKPVILSTGMATFSEISEVVELLKTSSTEFALLKCTSAYPATVEDANILTIPDLRLNFGCEVGLSDHTIGIGASLAAISHGASIIEKHFTLSRSDGGVDSKFSMEPHEMENLAIEAKNVWKSLGKPTYGTTKNDSKSKIFRRSIYAIKDILIGEVFSKNNVGVIRPSYGLEPKFLNKVIGQKASRDIAKGTPINWDLIEK